MAAFLLHSWDSRVAPFPGLYLWYLLSSGLRTVCFPPQQGFSTPAAHPNCQGSFENAPHPGHTPNHWYQSLWGREYIESMSPGSRVFRKWGEEAMRKETNKGVGDMCCRGGGGSNPVALAANIWHLLDTKDPAPLPLSVHAASAHQTWNPLTLRLKWPLSERARERKSEQQKSVNISRRVWE